MSTEVLPPPVRRAEPPPTRESVRPKKAIAIYAPHLVTPIRNGGDLYIWRKWGALDPGKFTARLYGADAVYRLADHGWMQETVAPSPTMYSKPVAAVVAVLRGGDYLSAKFNTKRYLHLVRDHVRDRVDLSVYSYASTYHFISAAVQGDGAHLIETHNCDSKFFLDRGAEAIGPRRAAAWMAAGRSHEMLSRVPRGVPLVALGESDASMFRALGHENVIVAGLGYERHAPRRTFAQSSPLAIAFVGSLSVAMNEAAIRNFVTKALPPLRHSLQCELQVHVAGSRPSAALAADLRRSGLHVHPDLSDEALHALLAACHASILPFDSSNGMKLKFALSASLGIPVLTYIEPPGELAGSSAVLASRDMAQWSAFLLRLRSVERQVEAAQDLQARVQDRSWQRVLHSSLSSLNLCETEAAP